MADGELKPSSEFRVSEGYRHYVVWLLFAVYVFNFADRSILAVLVQPIKAEFGLSDAQLGLLGGLAFALFYTTLGIPIARLADRGSRVNIISISLFAWSLFTGLTGFAANFWHLLFARLAVGVGEAGASPPSYSLISDYFDKKRRSTALATYSMGISGGVLLGFVVASQVAQAYGWRAAFFALGVPGMLLSVVVKLTLREPPRGFSDGIILVEEPPPVARVLGNLWSKRAFRHLSAGAALHAFAGYGAGAFYPAFLMRTHGMSMVEVGARLGLVTAIGGFIGSYAGGRTADHLSNRSNDSRYQLWLPALSLVVNIPLALLIYQADSPNAALLMIMFVVAFGGMYLGPTYGTTQSLLSPRERALGSALLLFIINLVGLGFGPLLVGLVSDIFRGRLLAGGASDLQATAQGLVWALRVLVAVNLWAALHFVLAARTLREETPL